MSQHLPSYLQALRKQWGLSQPEIAALLDVTASALSRFEQRSRQPSAELIVAAEVIFGHGAKEVFPAFYREVEDDVLSRARAEHKRLETGGGLDTSQKFQFLSEIIERASQSKLDI